MVSCFGMGTQQCNRHIQYQEERGSLSSLLLGDPLSLGEPWSLNGLDLEDDLMGHSTGAVALSWDSDVSHLALYL